VSLNVLDAFIQGAYTCTIPLLLVERNIDLTTIGVIFSVYPIVFMVARMLFSSAADSVGLRKFFNLNALSSIASVTLYAFSSSPSSYAVAKATQSVKDSSLWAVNRNAAYEIADHRNPQMVSSTVLFIRALTMAAGAILSGLLITSVGFRGVFLLLAVLSVLMFIPANMLDIGPKNRGVTLKDLLGKLRPSSIDREAWHIALVMSAHEAGSTLIAGYILPIFLRSRGLSYLEIGTVAAMYVGVGALLLPVTLRRAPSVKRTILVQVSLFLPAAILVPLSSSWTMTALVMVMALGESTSYIIWESLIHRAVRENRNVATAIGMVHLPSNLTMMFALIFAGLLTDRFGFVAPFWIASALFLLYSIGAWHFLKPPRKS